MKRRISSVLLILLALSFLIAITGCSARSSLSDTGNLAPEKQADGKVDTATGGAVVADPLKKVIKDATLALTVRNADESFKTIETWTAANGASEFNRSVTTSGKNKRITAVYKIVPEKLNAFLDFLNGVGTVTRSDVKSSDITEAYYDAQTRLDNLKNSRDQLLEVQKKAVTIDEILRVQNELTIITGNIESLQGKIRLWDTLIAESTVTITISEESDPLKPSKAVTWKFSSISDIWQTMKNGFMITVNTLGTLLTWTLIIIVALSPVIAIAAVLLFIQAKRRKARKTGK